MKPGKIHSIENLFTIGELYLFHKHLPHCPSESSLWGMFDRHDVYGVYLESSSRDLRHFRLRHRLSSRYKYCRLATRTELRDYVSALILYEAHKSEFKKAGFHADLQHKSLCYPVYFLYLCFAEPVQKSNIDSNGKDSIQI